MNLEICKKCQDREWSFYHVYHNSEEKILMKCSYCGFQDFLKNIENFKKAMKRIKVFKPKKSNASYIVLNEDSDISLLSKEMQKFKINKNCPFCTEHFMYDLYKEEK